MKNIFLFILLTITSQTFANPHWDHDRLPLDTSYSFNKDLSYFSNWKSKVRRYKAPHSAVNSLRVTVDWDEATDSYKVAQAVVESSGTDSLVARAGKESPFGSFKGSLINTKNSVEVYYDSIGTGQLYRYLSRAITFRFPMPQADSVFQMKAENPITGDLEVVLTTEIKISELKKTPHNLNDLDVYVLQKNTKSPVIKMVIYAEGFKLNRKDHFFQSAMRTVDALKNSHIPYFENMEFTAVFTSSKESLGVAQDFALPVKTRDSAFGLYYPYWQKFGRWYHIVYPTNENKFRSALSVVPYDYNIMLVDSSEYWGVGNFRTHTAIPTQGPYFIYLLLHELGHYFGLNEEYDGGGRTELEFSPLAKEVWSQNITFLPSTNLKDLKWIDSITDFSIPIPTPLELWTDKKFGAYSGGYADSNGERESYKPGLSCIMESAKSFCDVCLKGMGDVIKFDLGL